MGDPVIVSPSKLILAVSLTFSLFLPTASAEGASALIETSETIRTVTVEVADTPQTRATGLMFHPPLGEERGMYFLFPSLGPQIFWMKNVPFALDILFIGADGTIVSITKNAPPCAEEPCPLYRSGKPIVAALELRGGWCDKYGVREGGKVEYRP